MFTGLIQAIGQIERWDLEAGDLQITSPVFDLKDVQCGDSIAVNGVCLTVTALHARAFEAYVAPETIQRTTFGAIQAGDVVNLEKSLRLSDFVGGHLVTGHVDGIVRCLSKEQAGDSVVCWFELPESLARFVATKGSICLHGVSLTVVDVNENKCAVMLIPHTQMVTTFSSLIVGQTLNLEVDLMARYCQRLFSA